MDMSLDPYKSRLDRVSIKYLNAQNGVQMKSWRPSQVATGLQTESSPETCWIRSLFFLEPKVIGGLLEDVGNTWTWSPIKFFGPPCLSGVFNTLLIHVCISKNDNEHTSCTASIHQINQIQS
jgi:hypothetical protein